jgi:hypothetical protein
MRESQADFLLTQRPNQHAQHWKELDDPGAFMITNGSDGVRQVGYNFDRRRMFV